MKAKHIIREAGRVAGRTACILMTGTAAAISVVILMTGCAGKGDTPDYSNSKYWYIAKHTQEADGHYTQQADKGARKAQEAGERGADIFYVCSTETTDRVNMQGDTVHFADIDSPADRAALYGEMHGVDSLLCPPNCDFYSPYYRQATIEGLLRDTAQFIERSRKATEDIKRAFDYYMRHLNKGRRFVLAGYSQGGFAVVELLKGLTAEQARQMVAAYIIGYQVTEEDLRYPFIRAAQSASDTGVTICYNSVAGTDGAADILSGKTAIGINPANWQTDGTAATYIYDFGGACDTLTARLDTLTHLTVIEGYRGACPLIPFVGKEGNYHCLEIPLYYRSLRENISLRCEGSARVL